jgi:hypothetical protein
MLNVCEHNEGHNKYNRATQDALILISNSDTVTQGISLATVNQVATQAVNKRGGAKAQVN